jgi:hypothetical protein
VPPGRSEPGTDPGGSRSTVRSASAAAPSAALWRRVTMSELTGKSALRLVLDLHSGSARSSCGWATPDSVQGALLQSPLRTTRSDLAVGMKTAAAAVH